MSLPRDTSPEERFTAPAVNQFASPDDNESSALVSQLHAPDRPNPEEAAATELASGPYDHLQEAALDQLDHPDAAIEIPGQLHEPRAHVNERPRSEDPDTGDLGRLASGREVDTAHSPKVKDSALPAFDLGIDAHDPDAGRRAEAWGKVETHRVTVSDGTRYNVNYFKPDKPQDGVIPVTFTTPWGTDLAGYNDHVGSLFAQEGMPTIAVSPEQRDVVKAVRNLGKASLAHDAEVHHLILDILSNAEDDDLNSVVNIGSSRGAMVGFGLQAYANQHDRSMPYNDYVDPVLAHSLNLREVPWLRLTPQVARELGALARTAIPTDSRSLRSLVPTFPLRPGFWVSQATTGISLLHGEAGSLAEHIPHDSNTHVTLFKGSNFNTAQDWEERLSGFPNVKIVEQPGVHLSFTNIHVIKDVVRRVKAAQTH